MESKINEDSTFDSFYDEEDEELNLYQGIMNQDIGKRHITMDREIRRKKKIINRLFKEKFGKNFIPIKLESVQAFESGLKDYLFSPQSQFLNNFPKLKRKLLKERKVKEDKLKEKINVGSLLYLSMARNDKNINDKFFQRSKNLSSTMSKNILSNVLYKEKVEKKNKERINKILSYRNLRQSRLQNLKMQFEKNNLLNLLPVDEQKNDPNKKKTKNKILSRNTKSNLQKFKTMATTINNNENKENTSLKTLSPFSTISNFHQKSYSKYFTKQSKNLQKDLNRYVNNLDSQTNLCNNKLISIINTNRKKNLRRREERNREIVNLKKIIYDKKKLRPKKKINNIFQIKTLINKAKMDFEGEATIEKIRKNELRNFGHYINIMSEDLVLTKVNELYNKFELKKEGKNFTQDELDRLKRKERKKEQDLIVEHNRQKIKDNYIKMIKLENDLSNIKDKFNKTNLKVIQKSKSKNLKLLLSKKI